MEVSYSDNPSHVITIDLQQQQPQQIQSNSGSATILYSPDGHSMTELQSSGIVANPNDYDPHATMDKISASYGTTTTTTMNNMVDSNNIDQTTTTTNGDNPNGDIIIIQAIKPDKYLEDASEGTNTNGSVSNGAKSTSSLTRFKWTKEKSQVAMNLVKHGCKPKLVSVAVGCSLRTAQKFVETVTPKMEGESFKNYVIKRRGRKSKDVNERLDAIREVLSKDSTKTQVEIAADLKVSNTTVCRDLKRIKGCSWKEKDEPTSSTSSSSPPHHSTTIQLSNDTATTTTTSTSKREIKRDRQSTSNENAKKQSPSSSTANKNKTRGRQKANTGEV